jgi:hypothetical protein
MRSRRRQPVPPPGPPGLSGEAVPAFSPGLGVAGPLEAGDGEAGAEAQPEPELHQEAEHHHRNVQGGAVRAAVFGVSDGLVTNVSLILGVAGAQTGASYVRLAGFAGLLAGAFSMAAGNSRSNDVPCTWPRKPKERSSLRFTSAGASPSRQPRTWPK